MSGRRAVLAGGNGFLGQSLARALVADGWIVDILTRMPAAGAIGTQLPWDGATVGDWARTLEGATAVVNFTGRSVNCRYTPDNRHAIVESRVRSVEAIAAALATCSAPPPVWVQAASLAIYGSPGDAILDDHSPPGHGFSADVCRRWEAAFDACSTPVTRKVLLRIGFALGADGGALHPLARLTRWGLGGRVGSGRPYVRWLHLADLNRLITHVIDSQAAAGTYNATGPTPVTNAEFMTTLRHVLRRPWSPPVPSWAVAIGAWLMRTEPELALSGRRCVPAALLADGFRFEFEDLAAALRDVLDS